MRHEKLISSKFDLLKINFISMGYISHYALLFQLYKLLEFYGVVGVILRRGCAGHGGENQMISR